MAPRVVHVVPAVLSALRSAMADAMPREAVAVLGGHHGPHGILELSSWIAVTNTAAAHDRFAVAPLEFLRALQQIEDRGDRLLGFAHSHPNGTTMPSRLDRQRAWHEHLQLIAAPLDDGSCTVAAYWPDAGGHGFTTMPIQPRQPVNGGGTTHATPGKETR